MADIESLLTRWQSAGVLDATTAARIRAHEAQPAGGAPTGLRWQGITALILGAILLACGVVLFVSAHWDELGPAARYTLVIAMVAVFHIAGGLARPSFRGLSTALHAVGTVATGAAIALVGQIFNIQEHWPAAVLLWALAALAGWMLLRDQAQQTLALLLVPAWLVSEIAYSSDRQIGENVYCGRILFMWAVLYLVVFLGSTRKLVWGVLFAASAVSIAWGIGEMFSGWVSWGGEQAFVPFGVRVWAWIMIAALPLVIAAFKGHKGLIPMAVSLAFAIALPWCHRSWTEQYYGADGSTGTVFKESGTLTAQILVAAFTFFLCWWGVRRVSRALVNLGVAGFAVTVGWFYFSDVLSKLSKSLGLIGLGILFLAGGWALEKMRRRILARMALSNPSEQHASQPSGGAL
jgi:uncharacterized membrane protein